MRAAALVLLATAGCAGDDPSSFPEPTQPGRPVVDTSAERPADSPAGDSTDSAASVDTAPEHPHDSPPQASSLADGVEPPALESEREYILLVNGRAGDAATDFTTNRVERSLIVGPEVYLYDPTQPGRLHVLGRPVLAAVGDPDADAWLRWVVSEVAWNKEIGLYAIGRDAVRQEWILSRWLVEDWTGGADFAAEHFAIQPGEDRHHHLYWETDIEALAFVQSILYAGTVCDYDNGQGGELFALPETWPPALDEGGWYMAEATRPALAQLPTNIQFAGDLIDTSGGGFAALDANNIGVMEPDRNMVARVIWDQLKFDEMDKRIELRGDNQDIEGLAEIAGEVYAVTVDGWVLALNTVIGGAEERDDLAPLFRDRESQIRLRGAARVYLP